jgi:hypothetical protein
VDTTPLLAQLPPLIRIPDMPDGGRVATPEATLDYAWRSPSRLPVDRIDVLIDGRPVKEVRCRCISPTPTRRFKVRSGFRCRRAMPRSG